MSSVDDTKMEDAPAAGENVDVKNEENGNTENAANKVEISSTDLYTQANLYLAKQTKPVIIPSFAKWFDLNTVHEIEKRSLPEFFVEGANARYKNSKIYKTVRDFIINTYRLNPMEYLSVTAVRRNIAMDIASIIRLYGFLSKWGLINYQIDPKTKSFTMGPQFTGHFQITLDKPTGFALQTIEKDEKGAVVSTKPAIPLDDEDQIETPDNGAEEPSVKRQKISNSITPNVKLNLKLRKNIYDSVDDAFILQDSNSNNSSKQVKRVYCSITGNDITETKYHNLKTKSNISTECFENGQFEDYFKNSDFVKLDKTTFNNSSKPWSNNEILLLLEGIEMHGDDWNLIAGHVGSRAKDQCIIKFIQLPIEDTYLFKHISKTSYVEYLKKLRNNKTIDFPSLLSNIKSTISSTSTTTSTTTTTTTTTTTAAAEGTISNDVINNINKHANSELETQDAIITSILKLSLRKFELKLQGFMNLESRVSEQQKFVENEKEKLILDKLKVKKQCNKVRSKLLNASDVVSKIKDIDIESLTPEKMDQTINEAIQIIDRAITEASYDPNSPSSLTSFTNNLSSDKASNQLFKEGESGDADSNDAEPISVVNPKLYTMWSA